MRDSWAFAEMRERLFCLDMLNSVLFLGSFAVIPAVKSAYQIAGDPADALKFHSLARCLRICHGIYPFACLI